MVYNAINNSASGLTAQRLRMDVISNNIANAETTRTAEGTPYRRQEPVFASRGSENPPFARFLESQETTTGDGVRVLGIHHDPGPFREQYDPEHPDANDEGYVELPNIDTVTEMVNLISASRAYEANVTAINAAKDIEQQALNIGR